MAHRNPTLSCRRAALIEQMVLRMARKAAPFDEHLTGLVKAYDREANHEVVPLPPHVADIIRDLNLGQPVPPEPNWIKRLFARLS